MQRKMATCIDLSYGRAVSTALAVEAIYVGLGKSKGNGGDRPAVEAIYVGLGKSKGNGGDRPNKGPEKRQRLVIQPFNQNRSSSRPPSYPFKQWVFIRPTAAPPLQGCVWFDFWLWLLPP
jgi:hypothetical protein